MVGEDEYIGLVKYVGALGSKGLPIHFGIRLKLALLDLLAPWQGAAPLPSPEFWAATVLRVFVWLSGGIPGNETHCTRLRARNLDRQAQTGRREGAVIFSLSRPPSFRAYPWCYDGNRYQLLITCQDHPLYKPGGNI